MNSPNEGALDRLAVAEETARARKNLLGMVAHELRTPLAVLSGYVSMLEEGSLGPAPGPWQRPLQVLGEKARHMTALVDDLLSLARLEGGGMSPVVVQVDLRQVVRQAMVRAAARVEALQARVSYELPGEPMLAEVDPVQVGSVVDNLVNNALHYASDRPVINVGLRHASGDSAEIFVEDQGIGISSQNHEHVFDHFTRLADSATGPRAGSGLGLTIARELAERNGGCLDLVS
ncbi:MAG: HAMP domain-containing histidine kinase, partial [Candidatus Dormibacteraeota bacterium]|nr:HAMP domain-containing histidine kinase [Candidatus Dormibacteraeota bacterium]